MASTVPVEVVSDFLGSAQVFARAAEDLLERRVRDAAGASLTWSQLELLHLITATEARTVSELAALLGISAAAASKAVDRLVRREILHRTPSPEDRRFLRLSPTPHGQEILAVFRATRDRVLTERFGPVGVDELRHLARVLDRLSLRLVEGEGEEVCFRCSMFLRDRCALRHAPHRTCYRLLREGEGGTNDQPGDRPSGDDDGPAARGRTG